jgi:hypothetical protein
MKRAALLAVACLAAASMPALAIFPDCKCTNLREMRNRYCSARAARNEYERIQRYFNSEKARTGETRMYSLEDKQMINQTCVQEAIESANDKGAPKATGQTLENLPTQVLTEDCRVVTQGSTCAQQIVEAHELYHQAQCKGRTELWRTFDPQLRLVITTLLTSPGNAAAQTVTGDTKYMLTSGEFAAEEATSYGLEMHLIFAKWEELKKACTNASDYEVEVYDSETLGKNFWDRLTPDASGKRFYKMKDLSNDPCPNRGPRIPSACTLK